MANKKVKRAAVAKRVAAVRTSDDASEAVKAALAALENGGRLTPASVVNAARDPSSPLHAHFEWDESKAAHAYRLDQARALIRSVQVVITTEDRTISTVHYVRDPAQDYSDQGYVSVAKLKTEPDNARAMLRYEFARAAANLTRAEDLADAIGMRPAVHAVSKKLAAVRKKVERQPVV